MNDFVVGILEQEEFYKAFTQRLELCRDYHCINACWAIEAKGRLRVLTIEKAEFFVSTEPPLLPDNQHPIHFVRYLKTGKKSEFQLHVSPLSDSQLLDEVYMIFHHFYFGLCTLRNKAALSPMDRLEKVEALVQDLFRVINPETEQASKRVKLDV
jgi:hypothetical protein